jgi:uncharacterized membrane protein YbhN (UPF0104 family)
MGNTTVSKKKIQLMVQAEGYHQKDYPNDSFAERYYKHDYIGHERIKSTIWFTLFYAVYVLYQAVEIFWVEKQDMLHFDYQGFVIRALIIYLIGCFVIAAITSWICSRRYDKAKQRMDTYHETVEAIQSME